MSHRFLALHQPLVCWCTYPPHKSILVKLEPGQWWFGSLPCVVALFVHWCIISTPQSSRILHILNSKNPKIYCEKKGSPSGSGLGTRLGITRPGETTSNHAYCIALNFVNREFCVFNRSWKYFNENFWHAVHCLLCSGWMNNILGLSCQVRKELSPSSDISEVGIALLIPASQCDGACKLHP